MLAEWICNWTRRNVHSSLQIKYLGHMIDAQGLHPTYGKIKTIKNASQPKNLMELHLFPSMLNYYSCF